ncbi:hypothetical protein L1049_026315 [Liquidambar formosana]|uniref:WRKY domain-containing protein n=1 Tax=Liquidambar formosana TaxID=63359 RepID=A0AAP0R5D4_LIQFO
MSNSTFLVANIPQNTNILSHNNTIPDSSYMLDNFDHPSYELVDHLLLLDGSEEDCTSTFSSCLSQTTPLSPQKTNRNSDVSAGDVPRSSTIKCRGMKRVKMDVGYRIAFRTKSAIDIMDDGFKWRKYGKKTVKNSPNPRNYYRCSDGGCNVKKRVQRDREDPSYVITTYEGVHNHESPCVVYCSQMPLILPKY